MGKQAQASTSSHTDVAERILAMLDDLSARLTALESPTATTPAKASTPAPKLTREAKAAKKIARKAKADAKLKRDANKAAGRMESARYACESCGFFSYNKAPAEAHTLKSGHKAIDL
jgi:rubrerythrin